MQKLFEACYQLPININKVNSKFILIMELTSKPKSLPARAILNSSYAKISDNYNISSAINHN